MSGSAIRRRQATRRPGGAGHRRLGRFGRYLVPLDDPGVLGFFLDTHHLAHNRRERLQRPLLSPSMPRLVARLATEATRTVEIDGRGAPSSGGDLEIVATALRGLDSPGTTPGAAGRRDDRPGDRPPTGLDLAGPVRWLFRDGGSPEGERRRGVLFVFGADDDLPAAVVKIDRGTGRLEAELEALRDCPARLPDRLRRTVPEPLAWRRIDDTEVLALSWHCGRSAYHDLYRDLSPDRRTGRHFDAAARWLADFHLATGGHADGSICRHGDFWPGNLILGERSAPTVVDWEGFDPEGPGLDDLFRFPFAYGLHYPWEGYRRASPDVAFARTFLEETPLSRHVGRYLETYCRRAGLERQALGRQLAAWLALRGRAGDTERTFGKGVPWDRLQALLDRADRSVFSG